MRHLVTGGAGFIGSHVAAALLERGDTVVVVDDLSSGRQENLDALRGDVHVVRGDICDPDVIAGAIRGVEAIVHHAAVASVPASVADPARCDAVNVHATVRLLVAARAAGVSRFVFAASAAAYGDDPELPKREDMRPLPMSPYAVAKVAGEHYVRVFAELYGMRTMALRYFNVFGPRQDPKSDYAAVIPKFVSTMVASGRPQVFGDGEQTRDFCYVSDVVDANLRALAHDGARGEVVNIAGGTAISVNDLVAALNDVLGTSLAPEHREERSGDIRHSVADVGLARDLLGFRARVSLSEGLRRTVEHFRSRG